MKSFEEFVKLYNDAANDDAAHSKLPPGAGAAHHALYTVLSDMWQQFESLRSDVESLRRQVLITGSGQERQYVKPAAKPAAS
jgi:hypothetical protein